MRVLPPDTCWKFAGGRIVILHHGLLPGFRGLRPYHDAYAARMLTFGATCHFNRPRTRRGKTKPSSKRLSLFHRVLSWKM